jgi:nitronate monooxygenase
MAGVSTPNLVAAVTNSGGLGLYGAALTPAKDLSDLVESVRSCLDDKSAPFGFNLFCPPAHIPEHTPDQQQALESVHKVYADLAAHHKLSCDTKMLPAPKPDELHAKFEAQVEV